MVSAGNSSNLVNKVCLCADFRDIPAIHSLLCSISCAYLALWAKFNSVHYSSHSQKEDCIVEGGQRWPGSAEHSGTYISPLLGASDGPFSPVSSSLSPFLQSVEEEQSITLLVVAY